MRRQLFCRWWSREGRPGVAEIEQAIRALDENEFARIAERAHAPEQERWDAELDRDASSGRLDFPFAEARDRKHGRLRDWPRFCTS